MIIESFQFQLPRSPGWAGTSTASATLNETTDYVAPIFRAPATGTLDKVIFRVNNNSSPVLTLSAQVQTLDSNGDPSGTAHGGSARIDVSNPALGNTVFSGLGASVSQGDLICVKCWPSSYTSGSVSVVTEAGGSVFPGTNDMPGVSFRTAAGAGVGTHGTIPVLSVAYSGDVYYEIPGMLPCGSPITENLDADGTIRRGGNVIIPPIDCWAFGCWAHADIDTDTTTYQLYDTDGTTVVRSTDFLTALRSGTSSSFVTAQFTSAFRLRRGQTYRGVLTTNNTNAAAVALRGLKDVPSLAALGQLDFGANIYGCTHNGSAWTDYTSANAVRRYGSGLMVARIDNGGGVGRAGWMIGIGG